MNGAYSQPTEQCPYCNAICECDWVDVGVGVQQCGPYHCETCGSSEMGPELYEYKFEGKALGRKLSQEELDSGWYKGSEIVSPYANTVGGVIVDHKTAKFAYGLGILDNQTGVRIMNEVPQLYIAVINCHKQKVTTWPDAPTIKTYVEPFIELEFGIREDVGNQCLLNARKVYPVSDGWQHGNVSTFHVSNEKLAQLVKDTSNGIETFKKEFES